MKKQLFQWFGMATCSMALLAMVPAQAQTTACATSTDGKVTSTSSHSALTGGQSNATCTLQPDEYKVKIYKVGVCTAAPTAPTTANAFSASNCATVFESAAGVTVVVNKGQASPLTGTVTRPAAGTYVAGYVELAPEFQLKLVKQFDTARMSGGDSSVGAYCWTQGTEVYSWNGSGRNVHCGNAPGVAVSSRIVTNGFPNGTSADFSYTSNLGSQSVTAYLVDSAQKLVVGGSAGAANGVSRMLGVVTFPTPLTINNSTTGFDTKFNVSHGANLVMGYSTQPTQQDWVDAFLNGPFSVQMSVSTAP